MMSSIWSRESQLLGRWRTIFDHFDGPFASMSIVIRLVVFELDMEKWNNTLLNFIEQMDVMYSVNRGLLNALCTNCILISMFPRPM